MAGRIAVIGSNMVDLVTYVTRMPAKGETIEAPSFEMGHGGKGANQAVAAARLGADVMMLTSVGDDMFADDTIRNLAANGIDVRHVKRVAGRSSGVAPIMVEPSGENSILIVKGANADLLPADIEGAADDLASCALILLQLEIPAETVYAAIDFGRRHGIKTLLNPAPAMRDLDLERIRHATFLVPNETELVILSGMPAGSDAEIEAAARHLIARGIETVVVTMGSRGALMVTATDAMRIAPVPVTPVDTTGAGDAFIGSFARFHVGGDDVPTALTKAARYAADSITRRGTQKSYATEAEFLGRVGVMIPLDASTLGRITPPVAVPRYDRTAVRPGIVHIGVGNFVRVHLAAYVDACLHKPGNERWGIVGVGLTDGPAARAKAAAFKAQDCLYTMTAFGPDGRGEVRVVGAIVDYLHAPANPEAVLARLADPDTRIVTLTITEGGYNIDEATGAFVLEAPDVAADLGGGTPRTVFGYLVEALARRRSAGGGGFTIASCDNLRGSGDTARAAILGFARAREPALADWIAGAVDFPNSMVDRLAPQVPDDQREALNARSGIADRLPVPTETFTQWVVEDRFLYGRPPLEAVGVEFRDDVADYLAVKGRLINASHVLMSYPALLMGHRIVADAMRDPLLVALVEAFLARDATPTVTGPPGLSIETYAAGFVPRFANPAIADQVLRVAGDGCAKLPTFHGQTIRMLVERGADLRREAFMMACFGRYLAFAHDETLRDDRGGRFAPFEPGLSEADRALLRGGDPAGVLRIRALDGLGLYGHAAFRAQVEAYAAALAGRGARETLGAVLA